MHKNAFDSTLPLLWAGYLSYQLDVAVILD